jgi:hypothetical protein
MLPAAHPTPGPCCPPARGAPRSNAKAKDSEWVRGRQALEAGKPEDVNEVRQLPLLVALLSCYGAAGVPLRCCCRNALAARSL